MLKLITSKTIKRAAIATLSLVGLGVGGIAHAQTVLDPATVVPNLDATFTYNFSVTDATALELAIVTVPVDPSSALTSLTAPAGFGISFDSGAGLVSFFEDNNPATANTFAAGSTVTGFSFTSPEGPGAVTFTALDVAGTNYSGPTLSAVPEPGSVVSVLTGFAVAGGIFIRRRSTQSTSVQ